jgi:hypothetical protein
MRPSGVAKRSVATTFAFALCLAAPTAHAELTAIRPEFQVSTSETYTYYGYVYSNAHPEGTSSVDAAGNAGGTFVVVWNDGYAYSSGYYGYPIPGAWFRRIDDVGRALGPEFRASHGQVSYGTGGVSVAADSIGRFVVVWDDYQVEGEYSRGILARRYNGNAGALGAPFLVNTITEDEQFTPKVALDDAGNFVVVWADPAYYSYDRNPSIQGRRFDSGGAPAGDQFQVNGGTTCPFCAYSGTEGGARFDDMEIAANTAGNFMVVWRGRDDDYALFDIRGRLFDSTGAATGPEFVVADAASAGPYGYGLRAPAIAADGSGRFVVVWTDLYNTNVFGRRFDSAGGALGGDFQVNTIENYYFGYGPHVAADGPGSFVVTWDQVGADSDYAEIYAREFDSTGTPVAGPFRVDDEYAYAYGVGHHSVAATGAGEFVVVWSQGRYSTGYFGVDGRQIGLAPVACAPAPLPGCRAPTQPRRGVFRFKKSTNRALNLLRWRWVRGQEVTAEDLGDPRETNSIAFCVYDGSAREQPLIHLAAPAGGGCTKGRCWLPIGTPILRFDYFDTARFVGGLEQLRVAAKPEGRAWASVLARKESLVLPATPLVAPVTVQLQAANGTCWSAEYTSFIRKNEGGIFRANPGS